MKITSRASTAQVEYPSSMSTIYIIRHGQASFGADNYDCLSELGHRQSRITGDHFSSLEIGFDAAYCGTMARQQDTAKAVLSHLPDPPELLVSPEFNEYNSAPTIKALLPVMTRENPAIGQAAPKMFKDRRAFQMVYEGAMTRWVSGEYDTGEAETWVDFLKRTDQALNRVMSENGRGKTVALFSSGGPISAVMRRALKLDDQTALRLTWMIKNASVSSFFYNDQGLALSTFNSAAHLEMLREPGLITYR